MPLPLIITLTVDDEHQQRFDDERRRWFPAGRTVIGAHVTLFHAIPGEHEAQVRRTIIEVVRRDRVEVSVAEVVSLGRGVAYRLASTGLASVHSALRRDFADVLTRQDAQPFRPHVTIQNKVPPEVARETVTRLRARFTPSTMTGTGLALWRYVDGPWEPVERFAFTGTD